MKKFLLTIAVALTALSATAQTKSYTDNLIVEINGEGSEPQETTINVTKNNDGTYCLSLNKFVLGGMIQVDHRPCPSIFVVYPYSYIYTSRCYYTIILYSRPYAPDDNDTPHRQM